MNRLAVFGTTIGVGLIKGSQDSGRSSLVLLYSITGNLGSFCSHPGQAPAPITLTTDDAVEPDAPFGRTHTVPAPRS